MNFYNGQLLVEILITLLLLSIIFIIFINFGVVLQKSQNYQNLNENLAILGFERYRNIILTLARDDWNRLDTLIGGNSYYFEQGTSSWLIKSGKEKKQTRNSGEYFFSFQLDNYDNNLKIATVTVEYLNLKFIDNFLVPRLLYVND